MPKLFPCPFCGGEARTVPGGRTWYVTCIESEDCYTSLGEFRDCDGMPEHRFASEEEAVAAWNVRKWNPANCFNK